MSLYLQIQLPHKFLLLQMRPDEFFPCIVKPPNVFIQSRLQFLNLTSLQPQQSGLDPSIDFHQIVNQ